MTRIPAYRLPAARRLSLAITLLGALSFYLPLPEHIWLEVFEQRIPAHVLTINRRSFALGRTLAGEYERNKRIEIRN